MEPSPKKIQQKDERGKEVRFLWKSFTEKQSLIEELLRENIPKVELASKQQFKDETAEDIRDKAMERLKETKKRDSDEGGASPKHHRTTALDFLREKTAADRENKQQKSKLRAKQQEQESQQQMIKAVMIQQQQLNNALLNVVKSYLQCISDQLSKCFYFNN